MINLLLFDTYEGGEAHKYINAETSLYHNIDLDSICYVRSLSIASHMIKCPWS